jgi:hypothetical protein
MPAVVQHTSFTNKPSQPTPQALEQLRQHTAAAVAARAAAAAQAGRGAESAAAAAAAALARERQRSEQLGSRLKSTHCELQEQRRELAAALSQRKSEDGQAAERAAELAQQLAAARRELEEQRRALAAEVQAARAAGAASARAEEAAAAGLRRAELLAAQAALAGERREARLREALALEREEVRRARVKVAVLEREVLGGDGGGGGNGVCQLPPSAPLWQHGKGVLSAGSPHRLVSKQRLCSSSRSDQGGDLRAAADHSRGGAGGDGPVGLLERAFSSSSGSSGQPPPSLAGLVGCAEELLSALGHRP